MRIVCVDGDGERDVELRLGRPDASVADLATAVRMSAGSGLCVDGWAVSPGRGLLRAGRLPGAAW